MRVYCGGHDILMPYVIEIEQFSDSKCMLRIY